MTAHRCPGPGCERTVASDKLACYRHWGQVSPAVQNKVYAAWRGGRGAGSDEHTLAMEEAIAEMKA